MNDNVTLGRGKGADEGGRDHRKQLRREPGKERLFERNVGRQDSEIEISEGSGRDKEVSLLNLGKSGTIS